MGAPITEVNTSVGEWCVWASGTNGFSASLNREVDRTTAREQTERGKYQRAHGERKSKVKMSARGGCVRIQNNRNYQTIAAHKTTSACSLVRSHADPPALQPSSETFTRPRSRHRHGHKMSHDRFRVATLVVHMRPSRISGTNKRYLHNRSERCVGGVDFQDEPCWSPSQFPDG